MYRVIIGVVSVLEWLTTLSNKYVVLLCSILGDQLTAKPTSDRQVVAPGAMDSVEYSTN